MLVPGAFLFATTSPASASATITIGRPTLVNRVLINLPITVTCDVGNPASSFFPPTANVQQAVGKQIATGSGYASFGSFPFTVNCDGVTPTTFVIQISASPSGPPFHGGSAVASANFSIFGPAGSESASTGLVSVRL
jgi:hypothetical protein